MHNEGARAKKLHKNYGKEEGHESECATGKPFQRKHAKAKAAAPRYEERPLSIYAYPVSYTHLDVYKRQAKGPPLGYRGKSCVLQQRCPRLWGIEARACSDSAL